MSPVMGSALTLARSRLVGLLTPTATIARSRTRQRKLHSTRSCACLGADLCNSRFAFWDSASSDARCLLDQLPAPQLQEGGVPAEQAPLRTALPICPQRGARGAVSARTSTRLERDPLRRWSAVQAPVCAPGAIGAASRSQARLACSWGTSYVHLALHL